MKVQINDEYSKLKKVVVASASYYDEANAALNNETIKYYAKIGKMPSKEIILKEQEEFWRALERQNIEVLKADPVEKAKGQMFTRDLAFVIGNKFFIANMRKENRRNAINGWQKIISKIDKESIIKVPDNIFLEGGDVLINNKVVYVGLSERTNMDGVNFLKQALGSEYQVIPLKLKPKFLHLDVVMTLIGPSLMIVYKDGLEPDSYDLLSAFDKIEINEKEQFELATNVFVISPQKIIMNAHHTRVKEELEKRNIEVILLDLSETAKDGGAFRCTTCPLERE